MLRIIRDICKKYRRCSDGCPLYYNKVCLVAIPPVALTDEQIDKITTIVENDEQFHCGIEKEDYHAYNCKTCSNKCEMYYQWVKEVNHTHKTVEHLEKE